jgi:hypothetical protein
MFPIVSYALLLLSFSNKESSHPMNLRTLFAGISLYYLLLCTRLLQHTITSSAGSLLMAAVLVSYELDYLDIYRPIYIHCTIAFPLALEFLPPCHPQKSKPGYALYPNVSGGGDIQPGHLLWVDSHANIQKRGVRLVTTTVAL